MTYLFILSRTELYCYLLKFYILCLHTGRVMSKFEVQSQTGEKPQGIVLAQRYFLPPLSQRSALTCSCLQREGIPLQIWCLPCGLYQQDKPTYLCWLLANFATATQVNHLDSHSPEMISHSSPWC